MTGTLPSSLIDTVRALAPQIEASAEESEQTRRLPPPSNYEMAGQAFLGLDMSATLLAMDDRGAG